jgi:hypothetical protein
MSYEFSFFAQYFNLSTLNLTKKGGEGLELRVTSYELRVTNYELRIMGF